MKNNMSKILVMLALTIGLSACGGGKLPKGEAKYPTGADRATTGGDIYAEPKGIFGDDGLSIFGNQNKKKSSGETGIGVNSYLWRAALDTISFMPLASADPFGGVIITDWHSESTKPNERFKLNVFILDEKLVSTGVDVKVFRQVKKSGQWFNGDVADDTATKLEDSILTRARQLRVAGLEE